MKCSAMISTFAVLLAMASFAAAQQAPELPQPGKEHQWLQQLVGEWETHAVAAAAPGEPAFECRGTETVRSVGGFWTVAESKGDVMGTTMHGVLTLGYDAHKKKYVGSWIDSMTGHMWVYEGTLDEDGKKLTLLTEGPNPMAPGKMVKAKEVMELKDQDHRTFTSHMQGEDGQWQHIVTVTYTRKK